MVRAVNPWFLWIVLAVIALGLISYSVRRYRSKTLRGGQRVVVYEKPFLQSPEYRCSTKCFDCVKQQSHLYLQKSHGRPNMHVGM